MNLPSTPCPECGAQFVRIPVTKKFCSSACTQRHHNRRIMGGLKLYDAAMRWRLDNSRAKKGLLTALTAVADQLASEEREIIRKRRERVRSRSAPTELEASASGRRALQESAPELADVPSRI